MAKRKIKIDPEFDFILIGIVTPLQDYRLAWFLNNILHKSLSKEEDIVISDAAGRKQLHFSRYDYFEELTMTNFHLLHNKHNTEHLIAETKEIDFFLLIKGDYYKPRKNDILKKIRSIDEIQTAVILDAEKLRGKNNLILSWSLNTIINENKK